MLNKDSLLLERAYLAINTKPTTDGVQPNDELVDGPASTAPVKELAPNIKFRAPSPDEGQEDPTEPVIDLEEPGLETIEEIPTDNEAHEMAIDNLNSIRESIMKIAFHCASGAELEVYQQQKLAIAMDNLACVARSIH